MKHGRRLIPVYPSSRSLRAQDILYANPCSTVMSARSATSYWRDLSPMDSGSHRPAWTQAAKALAAASRARLSHRRREGRASSGCVRKRNGASSVPLVVPLDECRWQVSDVQRVPAFGKAVELRQNAGTYFLGAPAGRGSQEPNADGGARIANPRKTADFAVRPVPRWLSHALRCSAWLN